MRFINRVEEMKRLDTLCQQDRALIVVYGRRRVGKTRLIQEFTAAKGHFFFTFANTSAGVQREEFRQRAAEYLRDDMILKIHGDWYDILRYLFRQMPEGDIVVLDEFTYAIRADRKILSDIQRLWDGEFRDRPLKILISGSILGMIRDEVLAHTSPIYGRRTGSLQLKEFDYRHSIEFFPDPEYGFAAYMLVGGMPEYLLVASKYSTIEELVQNEFLSQQGYFYREPYFMLSQELKEMKIYFSVLNAIAYRKTRPVDIAGFVGIPARAVYPYLENLQRLEFVARELPIGDGVKQGIYRLSVPMIYSWFNIVHRRRHEIEMGIARFSAEEINRISGHSFEYAAREFLLERNRKEPMFNRIGRWWKGGSEIDIVALNTDKKKVLFFEVKYQELTRNRALKVIRELERKVENTPFVSGDMTQIYGIIARKLKDREGVREKGYLAFDLEDILNGPN